MVEKLNILLPKRVTILDVKHKKILITGADGFIGSHLTEALVRRGYSVRAIVQYNSLNSWGWLDDCGKDTKGEFEVTALDIRDSYALKQAMKSCQVVMHLAALIAIPYSYMAPEAYIDTNIKGTLNVLQAARDLQVSKIIHTSTSEVYGTAQFVPITEAHPLQGQSPYSASKIGADQLANSFYASFGLPVMTLRPFNTYGPRQSARAVIPTIITQLAAGKNQIALGALTPTRDFNYVEDTVAGYISALESENGIGEVINLGSNYEISIQATALLIAKLMEKEIEISLENDRVRPERSEVERLWADNSKAKALLGWSPNFTGLTGLSEGLTKTIEWFGKMENLSMYKTEIFNL